MKVTHTLIHTLPPTHLSSSPTLVPHSRTYVDTYMKDSNVYCGAGDVAVVERDVSADDDECMKLKDAYKSLYE